MARPWGSRPAGSSDWGPSSSRARIVSARRRASPAEEPTPMAATSTFARTLSPPNRCPCWKLRAMPARARRAAFHEVTSDPSTTTEPLSGRSNPVMQLTSVVFPAPLGPIRPTTSRRPTSRSTSLSAWTPWNERETPVARRRLFTRLLVERHRLSRLHRAGEARLSVLDLDHAVLAAERRVELGREADRAGGSVEVGEVLGARGELRTVGRSVVLLHRLDDPIHRRRARDESAGGGRLARLLHLCDEVAHLRIRVVAVHRRVGDHVDVVRHALALGEPKRAVERPWTDYRRLVPAAAHPRHERRQVLLRRGAHRDGVGLSVVHAADDVVDRAVALREALLAHDLAAELREPLLERLADVLRVGDRLVRHHVGGLPALPVGELRERGALVLRDVAVAERELAVVAEPFRAHLVGADARRNRQQPGLDALLRGRRRPVHIAGDPEDVRALVDQVDRSRLRARRIEAGVLDLELELAPVHAAGGVDLVGPDLSGGQRRTIEELHELRLVDGGADHDRPLLGGRLSAATTAPIVVIVVATPGGDHEKR